MMYAYRLSAVVLSMGVAAVAAPVVAATIVPVSATASSSFAGYGSGFAIDQAGNSAVTDWASNSQGAGSFLNLDLGALYTLTSANIVDRVTSGGGNGGFVGGTTDFTTRFSLAFYADSGFTTALNTYTFNKTAPTNATSPNDFAFTASLAGSPATRYVRYTVLATNGPNPGLSNISFQNLVAVPEPATWGMMLMGFGGLGFSMRRRARVGTRIRFA